MRDLILYTKTGQVACAGCEATKSKMLTAGIDFEERSVDNMGSDAVLDKTIGEALHAYWFRNDHMPESAPVLISKVFRELWDSEDLEYMDFGKEQSHDRLNPA